MKKSLMAGTSLLVLAASSATSHAVPVIDFTQNPPGITTFTASATGVYDIIAGGAQGGGNGSYAGGSGAAIEAEFDLTVGETLSILVGGIGSNGQSGGGGSYFYLGKVPTGAGPGGGGGSYVGPSGTLLSAVPGANAGGGYVTIEQNPVPEPASLALLGLGFGGAMFARRLRAG